MITDQNIKIGFFKSYCVIKDLLDRMKPIASGVRVGGLYKLNVGSVPHQALTSSTMTAENMWHQRFSHINFNDLQLLQKQGMVNGLPILKNVHVDCEAWSLGMMHRDEFPINVDRKKRDILELVHSDLCGPMQMRSLGGAYYFLLFIDDCTRFSLEACLRSRGKFIKILRSDQGGE